MQPIVVYSLDGTGPNPQKVGIILEELRLPYINKPVQGKDIKGDGFTRLNPNGRAPAIEDPNTGIVLWESAAIIEYLIETYDKSYKLTFTTTPEKFYLKQWLFFQASGQGPYWGQAAWFIKFHHENLPSVSERYLKEIRRVVGVLDTWLERRQWLVGDKCTFVDLCWVPWNNLIDTFILSDRPGEWKPAEEFPNYHAWHTRLMERASVKAMVENFKRG